MDPLAEPPEDEEEDRDGQGKEPVPDDPEEECAAELEGEQGPCHAAEEARTAGAAASAKEGEHTTDDGGGESEPGEYAQDVLDPRQGITPSEVGVLTPGSEEVGESSHELGEAVLEHRATFLPPEADLQVGEEGTEGKKIHENSLFVNRFVCYTFCTYGRCYRA